jgi:polysaccharide pyruvyl transferase WcaK-like protein
MKFLGRQIPTFSISPKKAPSSRQPEYLIRFDRRDRQMLREARIDRAMYADAKIGLLHHVGGGNLGDDATLDAVAGNIKRRWPNAEIVALSMNPDDTERQHGIKSYDLRRNRWAIGYKATGAGASFKASVKALARKYWPVLYLLNAISVAIRLPTDMLGELSFLVSSRRILKSIDLLIISGGGQLTEKDGPWGFPYTIFKWVVLAKSAGVSCVFLNVGAGPLTRPLSKLFARQALRAADYVSLRDDKSRTLVHEIGFTGESRVCPDSVYGLEFAPAKSSAREGSCQSIVGFAPMPYPDPDPSGCLTERNQVVYEAFIRKLAGFASWLVSRSYALALFGTDVGVDPLAIEDLQQALLSYHGILPSPSGVSHSVTSVRDLLATISGMDYVVTCRFHGVIFAHLLNKPVLAVAHHPKVTELMSDLELSNYCVDIRDFNASLLAERFTSMVNDAEEIKSRMATKLTRNGQLLRYQFDELFDLKGPRASGLRIGKER